MADATKSRRAVKTRQKGTAVPSWRPTFSDKYRRLDRRHLFPWKLLGKLMVQDKIVECFQGFRVALKGLVLRVQGVPESRIPIRGVQSKVFGNLFSLG
jgi:hypothetical protein